MALKMSPCSSQQVPWWEEVRLPPGCTLRHGEGEATCTCPETASLPGPEPDRACVPNAGPRCGWGARDALGGPVSAGLVRGTGLLRGQNCPRLGSGARGRKKTMPGHGDEGDTGQGVSATSSRLLRAPPSSSCLCRHSSPPVEARQGRRAGDLPPQLPGVREPGDAPAPGAQQRRRIQTQPRSWQPHHCVPVQTGASVFN